MNRGQLMEVEKCYMTCWTREEEIVMAHFMQMSLNLNKSNQSWLWSLAAFQTIIELPIEFVRLVVRGKIDRALVRCMVTSCAHLLLIHLLLTSVINQN